MTPSFCYLPLRHFAIFHSVILRNTRHENGLQVDSTQRTSYRKCDKFASLLLLIPPYYTADDVVWFNIPITQSKTTLTATMDDLCTMMQSLRTRSNYAIISADAKEHSDRHSHRKCDRTKYPRRNLEAHQGQRQVLHSHCKRF